MDLAKNLSQVLRIRAYVKAEDALLTFASPCFNLRPIGKLDCLRFRVGVHHRLDQLMAILLRQRLDLVTRSQTVVSVSCIEP